MVIYCGKANAKQETVHVWLVLNPGTVQSESQRAIFVERVA
jgi:hypothetical protein